MRAEAKDQAVTYLDRNAAISRLVVVSQPVGTGVLSQGHQVVSSLSSHELSLQFLPLATTRLQ